ncbi:MAG: Mu transposase C-terminal domain-containing protein, partial [Vulcanimicrobiaceae bacterium]
SLWELRAIRRDLVQQGRANIDEDAIFEAYERLRSHQEQAAKSTKKVRRSKERRKASARRERVQLPAQVTVDLDLPTNIEPFDIYDV